MDISRILSEIDAEVARLQQARATLVAIGGTAVAAGKRRGRPKGSTNAAKSVPAKSAAKTDTKSGTTGRKRTLTPAGRKAIGDAMKRRWAERRKASAK